ncbi:MAG: cell wall hydrolase [Evtepia sp.]
MKIKFLSAVLSITILCPFCLNAFAIDGTSNSHVETLKSGISTTQVTALETGEETKIPEKPAVDQGPDIIVNGVSIREKAYTMNGNVTYVSIRSFVEALIPGAWVGSVNGALCANGNGFSMEARPGDPYFVVNGRYIYIPTLIHYSNYVTLAPIRTLGLALGGAVSWDPATQNIYVETCDVPLVSGDVYYNSNDLYWLSRIINAESGNQPLEGKIAVATVILNRVANPQFPNTIEGVVCQRKNGVCQFSPVRNGSIRREPNQNSVIAAKLALEGVRIANNSLFFNVAGLRSWASQNRPYVTTIADHSFYA